MGEQRTQNSGDGRNMPGGTKHHAHQVPGDSPGEHGGHRPGGHCDHVRTLQPHEDKGAMTLTVTKCSGIRSCA